MSKPVVATPDGSQLAQQPVSYVTRKLPHVTLVFWTLKITATTLGETGGDLLAQTLKVGYLTSTLIFFAMFLISVVFQLRARRFHPAIFWTVIVTTSTAGTTMSDFMNRTAGLGYTLGALVLTTCLGMIFLIWWRSGQTLDVENVTTFKGELLYWVAILFSNTLGTSSGDFLADDAGIGFRNGFLLLATIMVLLAAAHYLTHIKRHRIVLDRVRAHPPPRRYRWRLTEQTTRSWRAQLGNQGHLRGAVRNSSRAGALPDHATAPAPTRPHPSANKSAHQRTRAAQPAHDHHRRTTARGAGHRRVSRRVILTPYFAGNLSLRP